MVAPIKDPEPVEGRTVKAARVVEIIGPAGAGKTTLYLALNRFPDRIWVADFPDVRKIGNAPFYLWHGISLAPTLLHLYQRGSRQLTRREFAWLIILKGWPSLIRKTVQNSSQVMILDQGPIYLLAEMREFGPEFLKSQQADRFWQRMFSEWAAILDMVVWLDTTDDQLVNRIRSRDQGHTMKAEPAPAVSDFLARYRRMFDGVLSKLRIHNHGLRLLRFDTGQQAPEEIVNCLFTELDQSTPAYE
jgi:hypothetical protein